MVDAMEIAGSRPGRFVLPDPSRTTARQCSGVTTTKEGTDMSTLASKSFDAPDETRTPPKTEVGVVDLGDVKAARMTMQPGWRWSECIKGIAGTESCQVRHVGLLVAGTVHVVHDDGTSADVTAGNAYVIEAGHDAWVVGDETVVGYEFDSNAAQVYANTPS